MDGWQVLAVAIPAFFGWLIARNKKAIRDLTKQVAALQAEIAQQREINDRQQQAVQFNIEERNRLERVIRETEHEHREVMQKYIDQVEVMKRMQKEMEELEKFRDNAKRGQRGSGRT